jgi:hypothetical protein
LAEVVAAVRWGRVVVSLDPGFTPEGFIAHVVVELIAAVVTALIAAGVALYVFQKEARSFSATRKAEHDALRNALRDEIDDNLRRLAAFWPRIMQADRYDRAGARLLRSAVPFWSTAVWQVAVTTIVHEIPQERRVATYRLYTTLSDILETQRRLQAADDRDTADYLGQPVHDPFQSGMGSKSRTDQNLNGASEALMPALNKRVRAVLDGKNPIPQE